MVIEQGVGHANYIFFFLFFHYRENKMSLLTQRWKFFEC